MRRFFPVFCAIAMLLVATSAFAGSVTLYVVSPEVQGGNTGVNGNFAPGFGTGSIAHDGSSTKSEIYIPVAELFGGTVTINDIASVSYFTNKPGNLQDWAFYFYTAKTGTGDTGSWYHSRLVSEPYLTGAAATPNAWQQWSTNDPSNAMKFYDSARDGGIFGTYTDPTLADLQAGPYSWASGGTYNYGSDVISLFSLQTGSGWSSGFNGMVDGLTITLKDGEVGTVNFEAQRVPEPASMFLFGTGFAGLAALLRRRISK